jgi:hypothetical protein
VSDSRTFIIDSFVSLVPVRREEAQAMIAAVAECLAAAGGEAESFGAKRSRLLADLESAARAPGPALVDAVAARLGAEGARAREIVRAAGRTFLDQGERDAGIGLSKASSVAVEVLRASQWAGGGAEATAAAPDREPPSHPDAAAEDGARYLPGQPVDPWEGQQPQFAPMDPGEPPAPGGPRGTGDGPD